MERKLTTILSADVKGYRRLMGADEEDALSAGNAYRTVMETCIAQHRSRKERNPLTVYALRFGHQRSAAGRNL